MQKLESSLKNMVLVLVGVALIVGAVLAYINHLTSGPIAEKAAQSLAAGIKSVMGTEELQVAEPEEVKQEDLYRLLCLLQSDTSKFKSIHIVCTHFIVLLLLSCYFLHIRNL